MAQNKTVRLLNRRKKPAASAPGGEKVAAASTGGPGPGCGRSAGGANPLGPVGVWPTDAARRAIEQSTRRFANGHPRGDANSRGAGLVEVSQGKLPRVKPADSAHVVDSLATFLQRADHSLAASDRGPPAIGDVDRGPGGETCDAGADCRDGRNEPAIGRAGTLDRRIDADLRFHALLAEATQNPVFGVLLEPLGDT